jgi:hypothetical protein
VEGTEKEEVGWWNEIRKERGKHWTVNKGIKEEIKRGNTEE